MNKLITYMTKVERKAKSELKLLVAETLTNTLSKLKEGMSDKKFSRKVSKASKLLVEDFKLATPKPLKVKKEVKPVKVKKAKKETEQV
jgi:hypothetical protein